MTKALSAFGALLQRGSGSGTAPVNASLTIGTSNAQVKYTAVAGGTDGNNVTVAHVASGNNTPLSVSVSGYAITVNLATNGSAQGTSTALEVIAAVKASAAASQLVTPSVGTGTGASVAVTGAATNLASGSFGTEVFTTIPEVRSISFTGEQSDEIEVTNMTSPNRRKEYIGGAIDAGSIDFEINFVPQEPTHELLRQDLGTQLTRNWRVVFTDTPATQYQFVGYIKSQGTSLAPGSAVSSNCSIRVSGSFVALR